LPSQYSACTKTLRQPYDRVFVDIARPRHPDVPLSLVGPDHRPPLS
jgi:hypothetical protein